MPTFCYKTIHTDEECELEVEVSHSGEIMYARVWVRFFPDWIDVTERIESSDYYMEKIIESFQQYEEERKQTFKESQWSRAE